LVLNTSVLEKIQSEVSKVRTERFGRQRTAQAGAALLLTHPTRAKPIRKTDCLILSKKKVVEDGECFVEEEVRRELQVVVRASYLLSPREYLSASQGFDQSNSTGGIDQPSLMVRLISLLRWLDWPKRCQVDVANPF
jgi:hypothetical protein